MAELVSVVVDVDFTVVTVAVAAVEAAKAGVHARRAANRATVPICIARTRVVPIPMPLPSWRRIQRACQRANPTTVESSQEEYHKPAGRAP
jgi:hypothetical protein